MSLPCPMTGQAHAGFQTLVPGSNCRGSLTGGRGHLQYYLTHPSAQESNHTWINAYFMVVGTGAGLPLCPAFLPVWLLV